MTWNPDQYERFKDERKRPFRDLLSLVEPRPRMRVADLGCGTGETTRELHQHLAAAETIGIDNSATMLQKSGAYAASLMNRLGFRRQHVRLQVYGHPLESSRAVVEWVRGTLLVDYERQLGDRYQTFLEQYTRKLLAKIGDVKPYLYTYNRILMWGCYSSASMV